jgi:hypothetical protein
MTEDRRAPMESSFRTESQSFLLGRATVVNGRISARGSRRDSTIASSALVRVAWIKPQLHTSGSRGEKIVPAVSRLLLASLRRLTNSLIGEPLLCQSATRSNLFRFDPRRKG